MLTYIISYGKNNVFTLQIVPILALNGGINYPACLKHVKSVVGNDANVSM